MEISASPTIWVNEPKGLGAGVLICEKDESQQQDKIKVAANNLIVLVNIFIVALILI